MDGLPALLSLRVHGSRIWLARQRDTALDQPHSVTTGKGPHLAEQAEKLNGERQSQVRDPGLSHSGDGTQRTWGGLALFKRVGGPGAPGDLTQIGHSVRTRGLPGVLRAQL